MAKVLPGSQYRFTDIPPTHPMFRIQFQFSKVPRIPSISYWFGTGGDTSEQGADSAEVHVRGISDEHGRLMVLATHNTHSADGWEREGVDPRYFRKFSVDSYAVGINVMYFLRHDALATSGHFWSGRIFAQQCRNELRHRGIDRDRTLEDVVSHAHVHHVEHAVNRLVTTRAQDGGAENLPRLRIGDDFRRGPTSRLFRWLGQRDSSAEYYQQRPAARPRLRHGHAHTAERSIDVQGVRGYGIADAAISAIEQVGRDDFEVVVHRMRERATAPRQAPRCRERWWLACRRR